MTIRESAIKNISVLENNTIDMMAEIGRRITCIIESVDDGATNEEIIEMLEDLRSEVW